MAWAGVEGMDLFKVGEKKHLCQNHAQFKLDDDVNFAFKQLHSAREQLQSYNGPDDTKWDNLYDPYKIKGHRKCLEIDSQSSNCFTK